MKAQKNLKAARVVPSLLLLSALLTSTAGNAQWMGSGINTYTTTSNVGIGIGPVSDARLRILNNADPFHLLPGSSTLYQVPGFVLQRDMYTTGSGSQPSNIMEVWRQEYSGPGSPTSGNELKFVVDPDGKIGLGKMPTVTLDVAGDGRVDNNLTVVNSAAIGSASTPVDPLTLTGDMTITKALDAQWRNIRARTHAGALSIQTGSDGTDGPYIEMHGITNSDFSIPGSIVFNCYGAAGNQGFSFINSFPEPLSAGKWIDRMASNQIGPLAELESKLAQF